MTKSPTLASRAWGTRETNSKGTWRDGIILGEMFAGETVRIVWATRPLIRQLFFSENLSFTLCSLRPGQGSVFFELKLPS